MSPKLEDHHRQRLAYVYVRQSTIAQVRQHQESTERQYALRDKVIAMGWSADMVRVLDGDLGVSGAAATNRQDFKTLVADVSMGKVGAVVALEASRLARSCLDWQRLLELCALTRTLVLDEDGVYDPADFNDGLLLGIKGTIAQAELHMIRARLQGGNPQMIGFPRSSVRETLKSRFPVYGVDGEMYLYVQVPDAFQPTSI